MIYVFAQFLLLFVIAWPIAGFNFSVLSIIGIVFILIAMFVAAYALFANRPGNFHVRPIPKPSGELVTTGIYHYIRHPMYCSLFFGGFGLVLCQFVLWKLIAWVLLIVTLALKARFEERALVEMYADYEAYQKTNKAFIPFIW